MALSSVGSVRHIGRTAEEFVNPDGTFGKTLNEVYEVLMTAATDSSEDVLAGATGNGLPRLLDQHPDNPQLRVRRRRPEPREESRVNWLVTVEYDIATPDRGDVSNPPIAGGGGGGNPLDLPVEISWGTEKVDKVLREDAQTGDPVVTSVGRPFAEPIVVKRSLGAITFVRNEAFFSDSLVTDYVDKVNSTTFLGQAAGLVYCRSIKGNLRSSNGRAYWKITYDFVIDPNGWAEEPLNEDMYISDGASSGSKWKRILDTDGREVTAPVPITQAGAAIPPEDLPGAAVFLSFNAYAEADFNELGLPSNA